MIDNDDDYWLFIENHVTAELVECLSLVPGTKVDVPCKSTAAGVYWQKARMKEVLWRSTERDAWRTEKMEDPRGDPWDLARLR